MDNEAEMRKIFKELCPHNQMNLIIHARQFHITQKEKKYEKTIVNDRNIRFCADIHDRSNTKSVD